MSDQDSVDTISQSIIDQQVDNQEITPARRQNTLIRSLSWWVKARVESPNFLVSQRENFTRRHVVPEPEAKEAWAFSSSR
jgi:hypothetical protein